MNKKPSIYTQALTVGDFVYVIGIALLAFVLIVGVGPSIIANANPTTPPGQGECGHGNTDKPCKDDPSIKGKDCDEHGPKEGGVNEDHCKASATPTATPKPSVTPTPSASPSGTPTATPSGQPSGTPSSTPSPTITPTETPSIPTVVGPSGLPTVTPTVTPTQKPAPTKAPAPKLAPNTSTD